jgi:hypothetical protein
MNKHKTYKAGATAGLNLYGWGNGGKRKRPKGVGAPMGQVTANINNNILILIQR